MFNLSDEQVAKLHHAIQSDDATFVLACLMLIFPTKRSGEFVATLSKVARQDPDHAEDLFRMAIELYRKYFPEEHSGGLNALCGLAQLLDLQERHDDIDHFIEDTYPLVIRAAKAIGRDDLEVTNGKRRLTLLKNVCSDLDCEP